MGETRAVSSSSGEGERPDAELERRLEEHFLAGGGSLTESLLRASGEDAEEVLRLLALNELAEHGLDLLEREGVGDAVEGLDAGRGLGDYRLIQEIGSGGMGVLYLAEDTVLGRLVALKLLTRSSATATERFRREAEITASLDHPAIVPVYARGEHDGVHYIAMRYIAGKDIERTLTQSKEAGRSGAQALYEQVVRWCAAVADGLDYAHRAGVVHRDVKPSNILVEDDTPYLVDFGLARHEDAITLTQPGDLLGTVPYMSPEQIRAGDEAVDGRTDVYSLGATLYQLLAGVVPFAGRSSQAIARQVLTRDPPPLRRYGIPRDLEAIVFRAMEKDRDHRYATASELRDDLQRYLAHVPVRARHLGPVRRAARVVGRYRKTVAAVTVALALIGFFAVRAWNAERDRVEAARRTFEAAEIAGDRGLFASACATLTELRQQRPSYPGLDRRLAEYRRRDLHDRLMQFMLSIPADERTLAGDLQTEREMEALFAEARSIGDSDVLLDEFRFLEIVWLWHSGRLDEARERVAAWEGEAGAPTRTTFVLEHLIAAGFAARAGEEPAELAALDEHPARKANERYFTALVLTLTKEDIGRGLREIDAFLVDEPRSYWARNMRAIFLREHREFGQAREVYSSMIDALGSTEGSEGEDGKVHFARYKRGNVASLQRDYEAALEDFEDASAAVSGWRIARARAHCRSGLGETDVAIALYREAERLLDARRLQVEALDVAPPRRARSLEVIDRHRADVLAELALCFKQAGAWSSAEETVARLARLPASGRRAAELLASIKLDAIAATAPPFSGQREPWRALVVELDGPAAAWPGSLRIRLARREAWFWGADDVEQQTFVDQLASESIADAEERLWRAKITLQYVLGVKHTLGDARLRPDATESERLAWDDFFDRVDRFARRAADDLGFLERFGFDRLKTSLDVDYVEFLLGLARLWTDAPATASGIFSDLMHRPTVSRHTWHPLVVLHLGEALEAEGDSLGALLSYKHCVGIDAEVGMRALSRAGRMVARSRDGDELEEILELMEEHAPDPGWIRAELRHADYAGVRDLACVTDFLDE